MSKSNAVSESGGPAGAAPGTVAERIEAVMRKAAGEGLTRAKDGRITGRVSAALIAAAKVRTGLQSDTELVAFALANVALEDNFARAFRDAKGTVDPDIDLGV